MALLDSVQDCLDEPASERLNQSGFTEARDSEWQRHQLGHMQMTQTHNHASIPPLNFFTGRMPFLPPNQLRQSTEGTKLWNFKLTSSRIITKIIENVANNHPSHELWS